MRRTELRDWPYQVLFLQKMGSSQQLHECVVFCPVLCARDQADLGCIQKGVAMPSSVYFPCAWLTVVKSKQFLWHHSVKLLYLIKPQMVNVLTSNGRCSSPNWRGGTYSSLEIWIPEKSAVARRKNIWNETSWSLLPSWLTVHRMKGWQTYRWTKAPLGLVLAAGGGWATATHSIALSLPAVQSGCRQTASWEWSPGPANSQTTPVDCDIRMCQRLARKLF